MRVGQGRATALLCSERQLRFRFVRFWGSVVALLSAREARTTVRRASFTAASVGNAFASAGSSRTMLVPAMNRRWYFPRTPFFNDPKSYSGRRSSSCVLLAFFIEPAPARGGSPRADEANRCATVRMCHNQDAASGRCADRHEPTLVERMLRIRIRGRKRIFQRGQRLAERADPSHPEAVFFPGLMLCRMAINRGISVAATPYLPVRLLPA